MVEYSWFVPGKSHIIFRNMDSVKGQLTLRGVIVGVIGCAVITASSAYVALKMGALPWPIIFAAIISLFLLKAISRNKSTLNEANVTHTIMSSGAMVAGGLAFTIPGIWMLGLADDMSWAQVAFIAVAGSALGLVCSMCLRSHFVVDSKLEFPIGQAAAKTLEAGDTGKSTGKLLFSSLGFAGLYTFIRDGLHLIPSMLAPINIPGVAFGIYNSPMMLSVGFLVGTGAVCVWFAGAVIANFGIIMGAPALGLCSVETAQAIVSCLGMGCMMGAGIAVIVRDIIPRAAGAFTKKVEESRDQEQLLGLVSATFRNTTAFSENYKRTTAIVIAVACISVLACIVLDLPFIASLVVVLLAFVACAMSAQSVGQTGIDPMEIFGLIVLLAVAAIAPSMPEVRLFFVAALVAVACGLCGDVMNDFKAGHILGTSFRAQWVGQAIGAVVGSVVAVVTMWALFNAYGADAFGVGKEFVSAQASVVATMVSGIPIPQAFFVGLAIGFVLYMFRFPSMMLGLGVYLPFYMSFTSFLGAMAKVVYDLIVKRRTAGLSEEERAAKKARLNEDGLVVASGLLGGESVVGIILSLFVAGSVFFG